MFLNIKIKKYYKFILSAIFCSIFLIPGLINAEGWVWQNIFPGSISLSPVKEMVEMVEYSGSLYAGTGSGKDSQVFRYLGSENWEQVNSDGFGIDEELGVTAMETYNGYLFAGNHRSVGGGYIMRTQAQGGPPYTDWINVNVGGFGDSKNEQISDLKSFNGYLYAATKNLSAGTNIWRTQGVGGPPYTDWTQVNTDGFSDINNEDAPFFGIYNGYLYVSTSKTTGGGEVWRTNNGTNWSQVQSDGFGNLANKSMTSYSSFDGSLYLGSSNNSGGNLFKSLAGNFWSISSSNGFGNSNNTSVYPLQEIGNYLYLGTDNNAQGVGLYRTWNGSNYSRINDFGFGDGSYESFQSLEIDGNIFVNASNASGGEIWIDHPPKISGVAASQNTNDPNKINITFDADDVENADNLKARIEYNIGGGWQKATIMTNDNETNADFGDPKVDNSSYYQIGTSPGYIETSFGQNTISTVWDYRIDEPNVNSNSVRIRVRLDDQILESEFIESGNFSVTSNLSVALTKSFSIASPGPAPMANNTDHSQVLAISSLIKNIGGKLPLNIISGKIISSVNLIKGYLFLTICMLLAMIWLWGLRRNQIEFIFKRTSIIIFLLSLSSIGLLSLLYNPHKLLASPFDVYPRDTITYRINYQNSTDQDIHDLYIIDEIPQYSSYKNGSINLSGTGLTDVLDADNGDYNFSNPNRITVFVGTVTANSSGFVEFKVEVNADAPGGGIIENQARGAYNPGNVPLFSNTTQNFIIATGSISGKVFYDSNRDAQISSGEWGIANAEVKLYEDTDQNNLLDTSIDIFVDSKQTDTNGDYEFNGLSARYYLIFIEGYSLPQNYILTTSNNPGQAVLSASDQQYPNANFGYYNQPQLPTTPTTPTIPVIPTTPTTPPTDTPEPEEVVIEEEKEKIIAEDKEEVQEIDDTEVISEPIEEDHDKISQEKIEDEPKEPGSNRLEDMLNYSLPLVAILGIVNILSAVPFSSLINLLYYLFQLFTQPFLLLSKEKKKGLGVVYNSLTKMPIDLALVRLFDKDTNKLIETRVTNKNGQYLFIVEKNKRYYMAAQKDKYIFPSKLLNFIPEDSDYKNLYYGDTIGVAENEVESGKISRNIPVDMVNGYSMSTASNQKVINSDIKRVDDLRKQNEQEKNIEDKKVRRYFTFRKINKVIAYLGPALALATFILNPILLTFAFLILHIILLLLFRRLAQTSKAKAWGKSYDIDSRVGIGGSVVRLFDRKYGKLLFTTLSKSDGRYGFLAGKNNFLISAHKNMYKMPKGKVEIIAKENGVINQNIELQKED